MVSTSQKGWMVLEAVIKQQKKISSTRFIKPERLATLCNRIIQNDSFFASVGKMTAGKVRSRCMTWAGAGLVQEKKGTTVRKNPLKSFPPNTKGTLSFKWIGGRKNAYIPGHPDYGDNYFKRQMKKFQKSLR
jgi:hypothetical protein